jgi:aminoglycoside phosphotransferase family enzyme/predicted kinase
VAPVVRTSSGTLALGALGEPAPGAIDWVVVMRRFDESALFDHLARRGALTADLIDSLADQIAAFHRAAAIDRGAGGAAAMRAILGESLDELAGAAAESSGDRVARVTAQSRAALDGVAGLLDRRAAAGHVRHCHGDLHLRNICLIDGRPTLFDAIEFSAALSTIDVLYDLAFLIMDLLHRNLAPLANRALNRYLERADAREGIAALPSFLAIRAIVRAKIEAIQEHHADADTYLDLALACLAPAAPRLVAIAGLSGTGKSTVARDIAPTLGRLPGALIIRSDVIRKQLAGVAPESRLDASAYSAQSATRVYDEMRRRAASAVRAGQSVVLDAVHARPAERDAVAALANELGVTFTGLWLSAEPACLTARVSARVGDASDATADVVRRQLDYALGDIDWPTIEAGGSAEDVAAQARAALG